VDIDRHAVVNTEANAIRNDVGIKCLHSDWDSALGEEQWEWVITNPPFLPKETTPYQTALCAGEDLRVFIAAVAAVSRRIGTEGRGLILSSSVVPRGRVRNVLAESGLAVENTRVKRHWNEKLFGDWVSRSPRS
jgi:release factor glutamine methyltransferase